MAAIASPRGLAIGDGLSSYNHPGLANALNFDNPEPTARGADQAGTRPFLGQTVGRAMRSPFSGLAPLDERRRVTSADHGEPDSRQARPTANRGRDGTTCDDHGAPGCKAFAEDLAGVPQRRLLRPPAARLDRDRG